MENKIKTSVASVQHRKRATRVNALDTKGS